MAALVVCRRRKERRNRAFKPFLNPLEVMDENSIRARYRLSPELIDFLTEKLRPALERPTYSIRNLTPLRQILIALAFYATGSFQLTVADMLGVSKSSVSRCVRAVSRAIRDRLHNIVFPASVEEIRVVKRGFYGIRHFPNVIGCVDGTLVPIKSPTAEEEEPSFVGRKGFHALNVQAVCDHNLRFTNIVAKYPGSTHDSFIFNNCTLKEDLESKLYGDGWLLGDSGYACRPYILTPVTHPNNQSQEKYNKAHCTTRCTVERMFGVWKSRFRCLHKSGCHLNYKPSVCVDIIVACAKLHNLCRDYGLPDPDIIDEDDEMEEEEATSVDMPVNLSGQRVRDNLIAGRF